MKSRNYYINLIMGSNYLIHTFASLPPYLDMAMRSSHTPVFLRAKACVPMPRHSHALYSRYAFPTPTLCSVTGSLNNYNSTAIFWLCLSTKISLEQFTNNRNITVMGGKKGGACIYSKYMLTNFRWTLRSAFSSEWAFKWKADQTRPLLFYMWMAVTHEHFKYWSV